MSDVQRAPRVDRAALVATGDRIMTERNDWLWRPADALEIPPSGDVMIREPREGWSPAVYEAVVWRYLVVRGAYPRTARMHPSTAIAVAPADRVSPIGWPIYEVRRHYSPTRIVLSDDAPLPSD